MVVLLGCIVVTIYCLLCHRLPVSQLIQPVQQVSHPIQPVSQPAQPVSHPTQLVSQSVSHSDTNGNDLK